METCLPALERLTGEVVKQHRANLCLQELTKGPSVVVAGQVPDVGCPEHNEWGVGLVVEASLQFLGRLSVAASSVRYLGGGELNFVFALEVEEEL